MTAPTTARGRRRRAPLVAAAVLAVVAPLVAAGGGPATASAGPAPVRSPAPAATAPAGLREVNPGGTPEIVPPPTVRASVRTVPGTVTLRARDVVRGASGPGTLAAALAALIPGDTLVLSPGVYDAGYTRPNVRKGTADAPITVIAAVPERTLIKGHLKLWDADHWLLRNLRIQATVAGGDALFIGGGTGWQVSGGEFFGGKDVGAYANVGIGTGYQGPPTGFRFTANCVHGAGLTARENQDHNIYVNFAGTRSTTGSIDRNLIFDHPNGAGLKLGFGGEPGARGPWGVRVSNNTITSGGRQILLHGDVRGNVIQGNLLAYSRKHFQKLAKTTAIYSNMITTRTNVYHHNFVYNASMVNWDLNNALVSRGDNALRGDPRFSAKGSCADYRPTVRSVSPYGRYGSARFTR